MYQQVEEYVKKFQKKYPSYQSEKLGFFSFEDTEKMADELSELVVKKIRLVHQVVTICINKRMSLYQKLVN